MRGIFVKIHIIAIQYKIYMSGITVVSFFLILKALSFHLNFTSITNHNGIVFFSLKHTKDDFMDIRNGNEEKKPRKRFLVRKAAELVRSVKATGSAATYELNSAARSAASKFNELFSASQSRIQTQ
jgi:hypothetical protein